MQMNKIMILGAGVGQVPLIRKAIELKLYVIVITPQGPYPGISMANKVYYEDVRNKEKILDIAKQEQINYIISDQLDVAVASVAYVAEKMHLPGIGYQCSLNFTNKFLMKENVQKIGIKTAKHCEVNSLEEAQKEISNFHLPIVIKPEDSDASRGVFIIKNLSQLVELFPITKSYSISGKIICEEFISGQEYVVDGIASNYLHQNLIIGKSQNFPLENLCISGERIFKSVGSKLNSIEKKILEINNTIVKEFGLKYGNTHAEYIYDTESKTIYLNEIAARGGGCCINSHIIPLLTHTDTVHYLFANMQNNIDFQFPLKLPRGWAAYVTFLLPKGTIIKVEGLDKLKYLSAIKANFIKIGSISTGITNKSSKIGPIIILSNKKRALLKTINKIKKIIKIEVQQDDGTIVNAIWA